MTKTPLSCWSCSINISDLPQPLGRQATCPRCSSWLRCCRMCSFYSKDAPNQCQEPSAELVKDKTVANFCDFFREGPPITADNSSEVETARDNLKALFDD